jgi:CubicO group peptidase (beta-lactamase class C family)
VRVDRGGEIELAKAYGHAHRGHGIANRLDTRFAVASGTKGLTAATIVSLIVDGTLTPSTTVRPLLRDDLPLVPDSVTVEHLLSHRSGIGDYLDEDVEFDRNEYVLSVPVHELATTEQYLAVLGGHSPKFTPGERFSYCNSGYVVLALVAERATGVAFHDLVHARVCERAGMSSTAFLRADELDGSVALGYLDVVGHRTNVLHLPVRGNGDGGIYTTLADVHAFWRAFDAGRLVPEAWRAEMVAPRSTITDTTLRYGLGFWLHGTRAVPMLEGSDAGVSFRTIHDPANALTHTVVSNTTDGAWPVARFLARRFG